MEKILSFIVNQDKKLLLLKGNQNDPQFKRSLWYVVTGACEECDKTKGDTVKREIKEETNLEVNKTIYLNWIFEYISLGKYCIEYVFITFVNNGNIVLNEESVDFEWCNIEDFINKIDWFGDKKVLKLVLDNALEENIFFKNEQIDKFF